MLFSSTCMKTSFELIGTNKIVTINISFHNSWIKLTYLKLDVQINLLNDSAKVILWNENFRNLGCGICRILPTIRSKYWTYCDVYLLG
jgi:hypothetical protein